MNSQGNHLTMNTTIAYAVTSGIEARGEKGNYSTERVKFNSNSPA
ncbi:hypothetical protein [Nostoc sp. KVJ20]|nr:hypothetical protein [Nostoc sp. KVJ20]